MTLSKMSWRPQYRCSKFRNVYGKAGGRERCYDSVPVTRSVNDSHFCAVNPKFIGVVTESAGGGAFIVLPLTQTGRVDPLCPRVCGHRGNVLDIKWNPFDDNIIASCSEDASVRVWEIPEGGLRANLTTAARELYGHSRRVGLIEWHPTAVNILISAGYDYKHFVQLSFPTKFLKRAEAENNCHINNNTSSSIYAALTPLLLQTVHWAATSATPTTIQILVWNVEAGEAVQVIDCHRDVVLSLSFNTDGSLLATTCKDRRLRVIEPRSGAVLQETHCKTHKVNRVVFLGDMKRLLTTGSSRWNNRQIMLWDQEDLSEPLVQEEVDGLSGLLFPFYDPDTRMLFLAGKGDGNIRYYEIGSEKPCLHFLAEFRSHYPQKGLGVMPKRGLDVGACEVFRFYRVVVIKALIEPISMIVPRRSDSYQEDLYPMTPGAEPSMTASEWLSGVNRVPVLMSMRGSYRPQPRSGLRASGGGSRPERKGLIVDGYDLLDNAPPKTENELLRMFYRQHDEIRRLREQLTQRDLRVRQLELELHNLRNNAKNA